MKVSIFTLLLPFVALWRLAINPSLPQSVHDALHGTTTAMTWPAVVNRFRRWHFPDIYFGEYLHTIT